MRNLKPFTSTLSLFVFIISTSPAVGFVTTINGTDAVNKPYVLVKRGHQASGAVGSASHEKSRSVSDEKAISFSEPLALILLGSALLGVVVLYNAMKSRKRNKNA
jgi:hypothetical protein